MDGSAVTPIDAKSITGKYPEITRRSQLLVVGAGPAGIAAALEGARLGLQVTLVDENPVPGEMMGLDVPQFYGQCMTGAVQNPGRMVEQILATSPGLEAAFDAGVEVLLGTSVWGAFVNGPAVQSLPGRVAGLADQSQSWLCGFDALVLATGARDLVLSFAGIERPGVIGANAFHALVARYDAFKGRRLVILGSDTLAIETAFLALDHGIEVAALVEVRGEPQGSPAAVAAIEARGVAILTRHVIVEATGTLEGVDAAVVVALDAGGGARPEGRRVIACDTICLAIGLVPTVELADVLGCQLAARADRGGHVATRDASGQSSVAGVFAVGDCAGPAPDAAAAGAAAARAAAHWLGVAVPDEPPSPTPDPGNSDTFAYRMDWMRALTATGSPRVLACLCEEVTRADLLGVKPPRYLDCTSPQMVARDARSLLADGPLNHDQFKRLTRASMGPCQARRCREQVAMLLALASDVPVEAVPLAGYRAPVRPLPLSLLATTGESPAMTAGWDVWFGIPGQWTPYADIGTEREVLDDDGSGDSMHL
ncbi:MAG: FAD-dependent oxidoreductase [Azospirillaceae bacterium]|nr:FAD-dependent oxidoreductase [Azospirillaceae bacterium]